MEQLQRSGFHHMPNSRKNLENLARYESLTSKKSKIKFQADFHPKHFEKQTLVHSEIFRYPDLDTLFVPKQAESRLGASAQYSFAYIFPNKVL